MEILATGPNVAAGKGQIFFPRHPGENKVIIATYIVPREARPKKQGSVVMQICRPSRKKNFQGGRASTWGDPRTILRSA